MEEETYTDSTGSQDEAAEPLGPCLLTLLVN